MSRLGKSFKNRFLRRALAMMLAGTMVLTSMPVSLAAEQSDTKASAEAEVQGRTEDASEEAAEDGEISQKESSEVKTEDFENRKATEETDTISAKTSESAEESKEAVSSKTDLSETASETESVVNETEASETETETDTEETETEHTTEEENGDYSSDSAALVEGHTCAEWSYTGGTLLNNADKAVSLIESSSGIYKNKAGDSLYIDASSGKFAPNDTATNKRIQIGANTKIYIPVKVDNNVAKIIIYQSGVNNKDNLMVASNDSNGDARSYFAISEAGGNLEKAECTAFGLGETVIEKKYYKAEWTCTLKNTADSAIICVEVKDKENYVTKIISGEEVEEPREDVYEDSAGDSADLRKYAIEGYAGAANVTGGGVMKINEANYHKVDTAEEFLQALVDIKKASKPAVIRITKNLNLGSNEINNISKYSTVISAHKNQPICSPVLGTKDKQGTGVSMLSLDGFQDLTIFSTNGAAIKHCCIVLKDSENIVFRNLVFDELWEWDDLVYYEANADGTPKDADNLKLSTGDYDRNDWDYICVDSNSDGVWIDHCTFYKSYDGVIDIKNPKTDGEERVTVSWCKFEDKSAPDKNGNHPFYDKQLQWLKENKDKTNYYKALMAEEGEDVSVIATDGKLFTKTQSATIKGEGFSDALIESYTRGQKKTHLLGQGDTATNAVGIRATFANNIYKNSMDRMPRLRRGNAHLYNSVLDAADIYYAHRLEGGDTAEAKAERAKLDGHLVSNGAISTVDGNVFVDTCYIDGIEGPILSGNGDSAPGYIGWDNCEYKLGDSTPELNIQYKNKPSDKDDNYYKLSKEAFSNKLPKNYEYSLYTGSLDSLSGYLSDKAGAGTVTMTDLQWTKVSYGDGTTDSSNPTNWDPSADNDPSEDEGNTEPENPPAQTNGKEFRASSLEVQAALTADLEINEFYTITKGCEIAEGKATINDIYFTKYIKLSTKGSKEHSIKVTSPGKGTVTVFAAAGNTEARAATGKLNLLDSTGNTVVATVDITEAASYTLEVPQKGVYYIASDDSEIHVYGIDLNAEEDTGGDDEPADEFSLRMDEIKVNGAEVSELESEHTQNGFTIKASSTNKVVIDSSSSATIAGVKYLKRLRLSGTPTKDSYSIHFATKDAGTLWVYAKNASSSGSKILALKKLEENGDQTKQREVLDKEAAAVRYDIAEAGDYYIVPETKGIDVYYIGFSTKKEEEPAYTKPSRPIGDSVYDAGEGANMDTAYNMEGYAVSANVTGGGLLKEDSANYHKVNNEKQFLDALKEAQEAGKNNIPSVIEITADLNLGNKELNNKYGLTISGKSEGEYSGVIRAYDDTNAKKPQSPVMHPTLMDTGVSWLKMHNFHNLTIFSTNGASIKHAGIGLEGGSSNIIIRNITFDELWEWDEATSGDYDRNDWDYMTIQDNATDIWIDHCTFYRSYDGILDMKNNSGYQELQRVTFSWCEVLPGSKDMTFFNKQIDELETKYAKDTTSYYGKLRQEGMTKEDIWWYAYGQKKAHLLGSGNGEIQDKAIRATFANNYYKNAQARLPRLRFGKAHVYNTVIDSAEMNTQHEKKKKEGKESHITGDAAISACYGEMLLENCYIDGARTPLRSGRGSTAGYINVDNCLYYMNGSSKELSISEYVPGTLKETDISAFRNELPYTYNKYDPAALKERLQKSAGAGKLKMTAVQWQRTSYDGSSGGDDNPNPPVEPVTVAPPTASPAAEMEFPSTGGKITLGCTTDNAAIYYTDSDTEAGLTDPADAENANRIPYVKDTEISITKETYIWAVAVKDDKTSKPLKCHYTVAAEGAVLKPFADPNPAVPVASGTKVTLSSAGEFDAIYYTTDAAVDLTQENGGRETYNKETGIVITETVTIRAIAKKGDKYSSVATFTYTIKADVDPDPDKTVASPVFSKAEGVVKKGDKITIDCATEGASIYYTTDGTEPKAEEQFLYTKGTEIVINQTTTIRAIAVKGENKSSESKATYTVEGTETPPVDPDEPEIKTIKLSECTITVPSIMESTKKGWKPQSVTYVTYQYINENGETKHVKFAEGVDYDADWTPGKQADGTYKVILTGRGRAADERSVDGFIIDKTSESAYYMVYAKPKKGDSTKIVDISKAKLSLKNVKNLYYTGYAHEPEIDYAKDKDGLNGKLNIAYRNNINAGKATVVISAQPGTDTETIKYVGSKTLTFTIKKAALNKDAAKATARVSIDEAASKAQQYMGGTVAAKGLKVETVVTVGEKKGVTLKKDEDYTVTYKNKAKDGVVTVTMTVKGVGNNLSGNCVKTFTIQQLDLKGVSFTEANGGKLAYSPSGKLGTITVTKDGNACTLKEGVDFAAKYEYDRVKKKDAGSNVKVTITGKGVCKGTNTASFEIVQADFGKHIIVSDDAAVDKDELAKKGDKAFEKAFTVTDAAGTKFKAVKDYTITPDKTNKTITIKPNSASKNAKNYTGAITFPYRVATNLAKDKNFIFNKDLEKKDPLAYDGRNPVRLTTVEIDKYINKDISTDDLNYDTRTYRLGGKNANIEIVPGTYKNNAKKGTAQVTVRGIAGVDGGFYGQKVLKFKIVEK